LFLVGLRFSSSELGHFLSHEQNELPVVLIRLAQQAAKLRQAFVFETSASTSSATLGGAILGGNLRASFFNVSATIRTVYHAI
jgi:hypothetical protein